MSMMIFNNYKEKLKDKYFLSYSMIITAGAIFLYKSLFGKKQIEDDKNINKRRKIAQRINIIFNNDSDIKESKLTIINKNETQTEIKYSKLKSFTNNMVTKSIVKEELNNPKVKQDYIFYQILNGMESRFKNSKNHKQAVLN